jgi:hypothetical protein
MGTGLAREVCTACSDGLCKRDFSEIEVPRWSREQIGILALTMPKEEAAEGSTPVSARL